MNITNIMNDNRTTERNENKTTEEQERQSTLNFTSKENEIFNYWMNENNTVNKQNSFIQPYVNRTNQTNKNEEINMLKTLWNRDNKNNTEDYSNNSQLDNLLTSQYIENYLSSVFNTKSSENGLSLYKKEQTKDKENGNILNGNILNENILDENILDENKLYENILDENILDENKLYENKNSTNGVSFLNYKSQYSSYLKETENANNINDIEFEDKNYINNLIRNSLKTEDDDFFSYKSNNFSSLANDHIFSLKKAFTQYKGNGYNMVSNDNHALKNFVSLDMSNACRNNPQTIFENEDASSLLNKNKDFIDRECAAFNKKEIKFQNIVNFENCENRENPKRENLDFIGANMMDILKPNYNNEVVTDTETFKSIEKNADVNYNLNNNNYINKNDNMIEKCLSLPMVMRRNINNSENVNFHNVLNEWSIDYLSNTKNNETNDYTDSLLQYINQGRPLKDSGNGDGNINNNNINLISRRNTTYNGTNMNKLEKFSFIPDSSPMNISLISSLNNKNSYFTTDFNRQNNYAMENGNNDTDVSALENIYMKHIESMCNVQNNGPEQLHIHQLKSLDKTVGDEHREIYNDSLYNNKNNNGNNKPNEKFAQYLKNVLIDIIETEENDMELFEHILDLICEHLKKKNIKKNVQQNKRAFYTNDMYNADKMNYNTSDAFVKETYINNFIKDQEQTVINSNIYSLLNEKIEEIKDIQNQTKSKDHNQTKPLIKYAETRARFTADYSDSSRKSGVDDLNMYNDVTESTIETSRQMNDSTLGNLYFSCLQNQLNANAKLEKEQASILQHIKEKENKIEESKENKKNRFINENISDFKFDYEKNVVESSKRFREEMRAEILLETMKSGKYEKKQHQTMGKTTTDMTQNGTHDYNTFNNTVNMEDKQKVDFYKTLGGETTPLRNLKSFFSSSVPKNALHMQNDSVSKLKGNIPMDRYMNNKGSFKSSRDNKHADFNWDQKNTSKNNKFSRNGLFKKNNVSSTINNNNGYYNSCESDVKKTYKSDNIKSNLKSKNNIETKKLSPTELKAFITKADEICLRNIIKSLYEDRIFPLAINLNGRAEELKCKEIIKNNLLTVYGLYPSEYTIRKTEAAGEDIVLFTENLVSDNYFVSLNNAEDNYSKAMWTQFAEYLEEIAEGNEPYLYNFSGGRYGMAKELKSRNLLFFKGYCLGELCHIVHLSTTKKLIAYEQNLLKPISQCQKYKNAKLGRLNTEEKITGNYISSMEELKYYIKALLKYYKNGFNISTLKKKLKTRYNKQISEIVFHCIKLIDVLQLDELKDICVIDKDLKYIQSV